MATQTDIPAPTHREESPARQCSRCGCWLRSYNESTLCAPCGTPVWEIVETVGHIADLTGHQTYRNTAGEALAELMA